MKKISIKLSPILQRTDDLLNVSKIISKVSKRDLKKVLKDSKVYVGGEFEFIHNDYDSYKKEVEEANSAYNEALSLFEEFATELRDWHEFYDIWAEEKRDELRDLKDEKSELEDEKNEENENSRLEDIENEISEIETKIKELSERLEESKNTYIEEEKSLPEAPEELIFYTEKYTDGEPGYEDTDFLLENWQNAEPPHKPYYIDIDEDTNFSIESNIEQTGFPFQYNVVGRHSEELEIGEDTWSIQDDPSLSEGGIEAISPPLELEEFFEAMDTMFEYIDENGHTDSSCGFHIHMSLIDIPNLKKALDPLKLILFSEEEKIWKYFKNRKDSGYVNKMKNKIFEKKEIHKNDLKDIIHIEKLKNQVAQKPEHYDAINLEHLYADYGRIEFRYIGGHNYHEKADRIKTTILTYAYMLEMSCDPEFRKKEYLKKLVKITLKRELVSLFIEKDALKHYLELIETNVKKNKLRRDKNLIKDINKDLQRVEQQIKQNLSYFSNKNIDMPDHKAKHFSKESEFIKKSIANKYNYRLKKSITGK